MDREALTKVLLEILDETVAEPIGSFKEEDTLQSLGLDSIDMVSMAIEVQGRLGVHLAGPDLNQIVLIKDLLDLIQAKLSAKSHAA